MRMVVIGLVVLAGLKVWTQDRMYRAVMGDALTEAYRDRAIEVCSKASTKSKSITSLLAPANAWALAPGARVQVGNADVEVAMWDTNNPAWDKRYRHPSLVLTSADERRLRCTYDLADGMVTLAQY